MSLVKQAINIPFGQGLDLKTDKFQLHPGKMLSLVNGVFTKGGQLTKRYGNTLLPSIGDSTVNSLAQYGDALIAAGDSLYNYSAETESWYNKGAFKSTSLAVEPLVRSATSQSSQDVAVAPSGLACAVWQDSNAAASCNYQIIDTASQQVVVSNTTLPTNCVQPRVNVLGNYFIITFVSATNHLQYIAIPLSNPGNPGAATDIATDSVGAPQYDALSYGGNLYYIYYRTGSTVRLGYMDSTMVIHTPVTLTSLDVNKVAIVIDSTTPVPVSWFVYQDNSNDIFVTAYQITSGTFTRILAPTLVGNSSALISLTGTASGGVLSIMMSTTVSYGYTLQGKGGNAVTCDIKYKNVTLAGVASPTFLVAKGVAAASKGFIYGGASYVWCAYGSNNTFNNNYQPTYFLYDAGVTKGVSANDITGSVVAKLAYGNGGGYPAGYVLPGVTVQDSTAIFGYLYKDQITPVNKTQGSSVVSGVYAQTGINLAYITFGETQDNATLAQSLYLSGGMLWQYDGVKPVEQGFHLWPEDIGLTTTTGAGGLTAQAYFYAVTYEWTDGQGLIHRSAPSVPVTITTTTSSSTNTLKIPTYRPTYKTAPNDVRICIYRWSTAQQVYYMVTSVTSPTLNDTTAESITYADTHADSAILGNAILYTTGGVLENIAAPAVADMTLFKSRLMLLLAEDRNSIEYSKQVIPATPVEFSDLQTLYVAPSIGSQGSTGKSTALSAMDDKMIIFKRNAIYYVVGNGPDITGANNDFSDPVFITGTVGCINPKSIVFQPNGLMFQSDKGIWLLRRDLGTEYVGAPVEDLTTGATVQSAVAIPGTNQVRFTLSSNVVLMYDYYFNQWGTFELPLPVSSSTLFQDLHVMLNSNATIFQENQDSYLDGSRPVLMSFQTAWLSLSTMLSSFQVGPTAQGGIQGYQRLTYLLFLGEYLSPFKLNIQLAYDFNDSTYSQATISPDNYNPNYGDSDGFYGAETPMGGNGQPFTARVFPTKQRCSSFRVTAQEVFDASYSTIAGAGFTLSGMTLVASIKKGYRPSPSAKSFG